MSKHTQPKNIWYVKRNDKIISKFQPWYSPPVTIIQGFSTLFMFLAVQNSSIGDLVTDWLSEWVTFWFWHYRVTLETCDLWDIWSEWWGDLIWPQNRPTYYLPTYLPANLPTSLREHPQGAILDTCDNWDIWSAVMIWHLGCSLMEQS